MWKESKMSSRSISRSFQTYFGIHEKGMIALLEWRPVEPVRDWQPWTDISWGTHPDEMHGEWFTMDFAWNLSHWCCTYKIVTTLRRSYLNCIRAMMERLSAIVSRTCCYSFPSSPACGGAYFGSEVFRSHVAASPTIFCKGSNWDSYFFHDSKLCL